MGERGARTEPQKPVRRGGKTVAILAGAALLASGCATHNTIPGLPDYPPPTLEGVAPNLSPQHICFGYIVKARQGPSVIVNPAYELLDRSDGSYMWPKNHPSPSAAFDRGQDNDWRWYRYDKGDKKFHESGPKRCMQTANVDSARVAITTTNIKDYDKTVTVNVTTGSTIHQGQRLDGITNSPVAAAAVGDQLTEGLVHQLYVDQNLNVDRIAPEGDPDSYR
jgi:hypothetical protein